MTQPKRTTDRPEAGGAGPPEYTALSAAEQLAKIDTQLAGFERTHHDHYLNARRLEAVKANPDAWDPETDAETLDAAIAEQRRQMLVHELATATLREERERLEAAGN